MFSSLSLRLAFALACAAAPLAAQVTPQASPARALDTNQQQARDIYQQLIEINTVDGDGNVTTASEAVAARFRAAGFPEQDIFVGGPRAEKHNVVVRLRGTNSSGARKPILLLAHLDVVQALKSDWSPDLDPFKLTERDGYFYGRGTGDDKAMAAIWVANLLRMKREGFVPDRDIIVALTADEENGTANGADWLVKNHPELVGDAAYVLNEGGGGALENGKPVINSVQASEKVYVDFAVTTKNRGGHSSVPRPDNAIYELAAGLERLSHFSFPVQLNEVTRAYFQRSAAIEQSPTIAAAMRAIAANPADAKAAATLSAVPRYNSMLRTTCVPTLLSGGHAPNALPQTATANVNCRILPGVRPAEVRAALVRVLADTGIEVSAAPDIAPAAPSPLQPEVMRAVESLTARHFPGATVIPTMSTGATDSKYFRAAGIPAYGVSGIFGDPSDSRAHGRDERILVKSFYDAQAFLYDLVKALASKGSV